ncbi:equilibrative nucleoside transporter [Kipferlia bialata]|uniref:Equilibrative nucleoside transporter n=1 Tax=Kipferlia bialata TaxID=797122 RepID=A0A9K3GH35_9EUKA|nr:equilibrative nucleoside transporter [Kipferlia bialata]|eukprot:g5161.t1
MDIRVISCLCLFFTCLIATPFVHTLFGQDGEWVTLFIVLICGASNGVFFPAMMSMASGFSGTLSLSPFLSLSLSLFRFLSLSFHPGGCVGAHHNDLSLSLSFFLSLPFSPSLSLAPTCASASTYIYIYIYVCVCMWGLFEQAIMAGNGVAGVVAELIKIITKLSTDDLQLSTDAYFTVAALVMVLSGVGFYLVINTPYTRATMQSIRRGCLVHTHSETEGILASQEVKAKGYQGAGDVGEIESESGEVDGHESILDAEAQCPDEPLGYVALFLSMWRPGVTVSLVLFVTLSLFPGVTDMIPTQRPDPNAWWQVVTMSIFMVCDYLSRQLPFIPRLSKGVTITHLMVTAIIRVVFLPIFILFICGSTDPTGASEPVISSDFLACLVMAVFALSNGYTSTVMMMLAPGTLRPVDRAMGGIIIAFYVSIGITAGVFCSLVITAYVGAIAN